MSGRIRRSVLFLLAVLFTIPTFSFAQLDTLKIVTYNVLHFPSALGSQRIDDFQRIIKFMDPDILVVEEMEDQAGMLTFLNNVMNVNGTVYQAAPFTTTPDFINNSLFYKQDRIQLLGMSEIQGSPRDITEYILLAFQHEFSIYAAHLKAGSSPSNQNQRLNQTTNLRNFLNNLSPGSNFILCGDFNVQSSSEAAFQKLIESQADNDGRLFDPINRLGTWHNDANFSLIHTQSTRTEKLADGGSNGGLDDRFDFQLVSNALRSGGGIDVIKSSYKTFGNDGNHFNQSINAGLNFAVPDSIADALHAASDHLPVVANYVFGFPTAVVSHQEVPAGFVLEQNYPNPFNPETTIRFTVAKPATVKLVVFNIKGENIATLVKGFKQAGDYNISFDAKAFPSGVYIYQLNVGGKKLTKKMLFLK